MMDRPLQRITTGMLTDLAFLMDVRDRFTAQQLQRELGRIIVERTAAAYFAGNGGADLTPFMDRELGALMQRQLDFAAGFVAEIDGLSEAQARARAALYAGPLKAAYSRGRATLWNLPFHPTEGTPCRGNCKCSWRIDVLDLEELNANAYWERSASESCKECIAREARNPYRIREGVLLT